LGVIRTNEAAVILNPRGIRARKLLDKAAAQVMNLLLQPRERWIRTLRRWTSSSTW